MDWGIFGTIVGAVVTIVGLVYQIMRHFKEDVNKNFEKHERRFERLDQRLFLLCMGKSLPDILKSEREDMKNDK